MNHGRLLKLFAEPLLRTVRTTVRNMTDNTLGCIRPGGVVLHLQLGTDICLMKNNAGWSAQSTIWLDNYMDVPIASSRPGAGSAEQRAAKAQRRQ